MKSRFYFLLAVLFFVAGCAVFWFAAGMSYEAAAGQRALSLLSRAVHEADSVTVQALTPAGPTPSGETYATIRFPEHYVISGTYTLDAARTGKLTALLGGLRYDTSSGALCHSPGYLLTFKRDGRVLLRCTLCLECWNLEISPLPFAAVWVSFLHQPRESKFEIDALKAALEQPSL